MFFAAVVWPFEQVWAATRKVAIPFTSIPAIVNPGGKVTVRLHGKKVLLVRLAENDVRAFNPRCTHKRCTVRFHAEDRELKCKCHKSSYDMDGKVLGGPAPRNLETFPAHLGESEIIVELPTKQK